jgi:hypothetical protein
MKKIISLILVFFLSHVPQGFCNPPKISKDSKSGIYTQPINSAYLIYTVDPSTEQCFVAWNGIATIPCKNLKKRDEWKDIITWVK